MWVAFYNTEIQNESSKNAENWFTNVSALKIEKSKIRHSPLAHIHQWVERPHGVTGGCVGSLHWPILTINFSQVSVKKRNSSHFLTWHFSVNFLKRLAEDWSPNEKSTGFRPPSYSNDGRMLSSSQPLGFSSSSFLLSSLFDVLLLSVLSSSSPSSKSNKQSESVSGSLQMPWLTAVVDESLSLTSPSSKEQSESVSGSLRMPAIVLVLSSKTKKVLKFESNFK